MSGRNVVNPSVRMAPALGDARDVDSKYQPSEWVEYLYYFLLFYSIMSPILGIHISGAGSAMLLILAAACAVSLRDKLTLVLMPAVLLLACAASFIAVQVFLGEPVSVFREFIDWMLVVVVVQWLALRRGFLHRSAIAVFLVGLLMLTFLRSSGDERMSLEAGISLHNSNDFGAWFGFCAVYFVTLGLEARRTLIRMISFALSVVCLLVVGLTVSRAPLGAAVFCTAVALRRVLKQGLWPLLLLIGVAWVTFTAGLFDRATASYAARGLEETGRLLVWPVVIGRFLSNVLTGVGVSHVETYVPGVDHLISPHNGFLFIAVASGIVPLAFFVSYWIRMFTHVVRLNAESHQDAPFLTSLSLYALLIAMNLNAAFMAPWVVVTLCAVGQAGFLSRASRSFVARRQARDLAGERRAAKLAHGART